MKIFIHDFKEYLEYVIEEKTSRTKQYANNDLLQQSKALQLELKEVFHQLQTYYLNHQDECLTYLNLLDYKDYFTQYPQFIFALFFPYGNQKGLCDYFLEYQINQNKRFNEILIAMKNNTLDLWQTTYSDVKNAHLELIGSFTKERIQLKEDAIFMHPFTMIHPILFRTIKLDSLSIRCSNAYVMKDKKTQELSFDTYLNLLNDEKSILINITEPF